MKNQNWINIGICGVDAGTLMVGDPCYFFGADCEAQNKGAWSEILAEAYNPENGNFGDQQSGGAAQLAYVKGHPGLGVFVDVGGDGTRTIQARKNKKGQIVEVRFFTGFADDPEEPAADSKN